MDEIDQAQEHEELFRRNALTRHFGRSLDKPVEGRTCTPGLQPCTVQDRDSGPRLCSDCGYEIGTDRLEANPHAIRCLDCQEKYERKLRAEGKA